MYSKDVARIWHTQKEINIMKKINVFDTYQIIRDREGLANFDEELLEKMDAMLDQVGVDHAFAECRNEDIMADEDSVITVMYNREDDMKFFLAYALFLKTYRGGTDEMIDKAMRKHLHIQ